MNIHSRSLRQVGSVLVLAALIGAAWTALRQHERATAAREALQRDLAADLGVLLAPIAGEINRDELEERLDEWAHAHEGVAWVAVEGVHAEGVGSEAVAWGTRPPESAADISELSIVRGDQLWGRAGLAMMPADDALTRTRAIVSAMNAWVVAGVLATVGLLVWVVRRRGVGMVGHWEVARERVQSTLDFLSECVIVLDRQRRIVFANSAMERAIGVSAVAMRGKPIESLEWRGRARPADVLGDHSGTIATMVIESAGGGVHTFQAGARPIRHRGKVHGAMLMFSDVTELEEGRVELCRAREAADKANEAKGTFLATMSHEIRTPINGVMGTLELLDDTRLDGDQRRFVEAARVSASTLLHLINDVLDLSKIEAGKFELSEDEFDIAECVATAIGVVQPTARAKGLRLEMEVSPDLKRMVRGDGARLRQAVLNIVANAVKFTQEGSVRAVVREVSHAEGRRRIEIAVRDTGIGIPADRMERLFRSFSQADASTSRRFGGTGLGLHISRQICRLMGGDIVVESEEGKGSTFTLSVVVGEAEQVRPLHAKPSESVIGSVRARHGVRVLIVEDHPIGQMITSAAVRACGCEFDVAETGPVALEMALSGRFGVVLMDGHIPEMDGFEVTRRIREAEAAEGLPHVRIIALTANAMSGDREKCIAAGMDSYLSKPVARAELIREIVEQSTLAPSSGVQALVVDPPRSVALEPEEKPETECEKSGVDFKALHERCMGDESLTDQMLTLFLEAADADIRKMSEGIGRGVESMAIESAHRLVGSSAQIGAMRLASLAREVEYRHINATHDAVRQIQAELERCREAIAERRRSVGS